MMTTTMTTSTEAKIQNRNNAVVVAVVAIEKLNK